MIKLYINNAQIYVDWSKYTYQYLKYLSNELKPVGCAAYKCCGAPGVPDAVTPALKLYTLNKLHKKVFLYYL